MKRTKGQERLSPGHAHLEPRHAEVSTADAAKNQFLLSTISQLKPNAGKISGNTKYRMYIRFTKLTHEFLQQVQKPYKLTRR